MSSSSSLSQSLTNFSLNLFQQIAEPDKNSFVSPFSIIVALAMAYVGAGGNTKSQIKQLLFPDVDDDDEANNQLAKVLEKLNQPDDNFELRVANRFYCDKTYEILQDYKDSLIKYFNSEIVTADFHEQPEETRKEINAWVSNVTRDKIRDLLGPDAINSELKIVLINAIYFKGNWKVEFDETKTVKKPFYVTTDKTVDLDTMTGKHKEFKYGENDDCEILALPYKSSDLAMFILLPKERHGLAELIKKLTGETLLKYIGSVRGGEVEVELPKFKMENKFDLGNKLAAMGMTDMFGSNADFSKISGNKDLHISAVVHQAYIDVNEKGSEAAAATGTTSKRMLHTSETKKFLADHPFLFTIVERSTSSILFLGQFYGG